MISKILSVLALVSGMVAFFVALNLTPLAANDELYWPLLAIAAFTFVIALGVWHIAGLVERGLRGEGYSKGSGKFVQVGQKDAVYQQEVKDWMEPKPE